MIIEQLMPALSPTMTEGTLVAWRVKKGDVVKAGAVIAEIQTDKAVASGKPRMAAPSPRS